MASTADSVAAAAVAAKAGPCSIAMKNRIGAAITGNADSQPATDGPQWRPATVMEAMSEGTRVSFSTSRIGIGNQTIGGSLLSANCLVPVVTSDVRGRLL